MDTGGLGLLQLLLQAGVPPAQILQFLVHQQTLGQPEQNSGGGGPGGVGPGPTGATTSGEGTPGVGPTDGTTTGIGNMTGGQAAAAAASGALQGAASQGAQMAGAPGAVGTGAKAALGLLGNLAGVPSLPMTVTNALIGAAMKVAQGAQNSVGPTRGQTFSEAAQQMKADLMSLFGLSTPPALPDININDPSLKGLTDFTVAPDVEVEDAGPTGNPTGTVAESGIGPGTGTGPTGEADGPAGDAGDSE